MSQKFSKAHYLNRAQERLNSQLSILESETPKLSPEEAHSLSGDTYNRYWQSVGEIKQIREEIEVLEELKIELGYYGI